MSKDTDKLAAEMQKMIPSESSKKRGMAAAMAAFDAEFASDSIAASAPIEEKISTPSQGSTAEPRPTGQITGIRPVQTLRENAMTKLKATFNLKPHTMMMTGSCAAALIAGLIIVPNMSDFGVDGLTEPVAAPMVEVAQSDAEFDFGSDTSDEIAVTASRGDTGQEYASPEEIGSTQDPRGKLERHSADDSLSASLGNRQQVEGLKVEFDTVPVKPAAPKRQNGIGSVDGLLTDIRKNSGKVEAENKQREAEFRQRANPQSGFVAPSPTLLPALEVRNSGRVRNLIPDASHSVPSEPLTEKFGELMLERAPDEFQTVTEEVVVQEASTEYVSVPAQYETVAETIVVQEAQTELVTIPETYHPDGSIDTPARTIERSIPAVTKTETRRVVRTPASTIERSVPGVTKKVLVRKKVASPKLYLRDEDGNVVREFENRDAFEIYKANIPTIVEETPVSTFSVDVDTASYSFMRASLNRGELPPRSSIRLEEMINYFPYDYAAPRSADEPFKANVTVTQTPWNPDTKLMHVGIKGYVPSDVEKSRSNLVFLIDTSGSMNQANKLPLLINSFKLLLNTLDEDDTVSIVAYASASGTVLEPTPVSKKSEIISALNRLRAGGSTAGAAGLELAYQKAEENFDDEGVNRVILATDGDFNVGFSSPEDMKTYIKDKRDSGVFLSVLGFGRGNYNDHLMQSLAQNGNGVAAYIDTLSEANKVLANEAGSALITIAKDVKIQVEFNPATIAEYRLIGYETRALKRQDFNNDKVDAGEIGAGHTVTAIYEMTPVGSPAITVDKLRYVAEKIDQETTDSDEFAFVKIRHKLPTSDKSTLQTFPVGPNQSRTLENASNDMRFATAVAAFGQQLRGDTQLSDFSYDDTIELAAAARGDDKQGYRSEFIQLVRLADALEK